MLRKRKVSGLLCIVLWHRNSHRKGGVKSMAISKSIWDKVLKVIIAVASAIAGIVGGNAMNL